MNTLAAQPPPDDAGMIVLILAVIGGWFILVGFCHALVYVAWRLHVPMPQWMRDHLDDDWGQH